MKRGSTRRLTIAFAIMLFLSAVACDDAPPPGSDFSGQSLPAPPQGAGGCATACQQVVVTCGFTPEQNAECVEECPDLEPVELQQLAACAGLLSCQQVLSCLEGVRSAGPANPGAS